MRIHPSMHLYTYSFINISHFCGVFSTPRKESKKKMSNKLRNALVQNFALLTNRRHNQATNARRQCKEFLNEVFSFAHFPARWRLLLLNLPIDDARQTHKGMKDSTAARTIHKAYTYIYIHKHT